MKTTFTLAAFALSTALFATSAFADGMSTGNTMTPSNTMAPAGAQNTLAPAGGGMMTTHKPKHKKHTAMTTGGMMAPANTMAPVNGMAPANSMAPSNGMGGSH